MINSLESRNLIKKALISNLESCTEVNSNVKVSSLDNSFIITTYTQFKLNKFKWSMFCFSRRFINYHDCLIQWLDYAIPKGIMWKPTETDFINLKQHESSK